MNIFQNGLKYSYIIRLISTLQMKSGYVKTETYISKKIQ